MLTRSLILLCALVASVASEGQDTSRVLVGHVPLQVRLLKPVARVDPASPISVTVVLPWRDPSGLQTRLKQMYDPRSSEFRKFLTPQQFESMYSPTPESYASVLQFGKTNGLTVEKTAGDRLYVQFRGTAVSVEKAFRVQLSTFQLPGEKELRFAPDHEPTIDTKLPILHVEGLNNFPRPLSPPQPRLRFHPPAPFPLPDVSSGPFAGNAFRLAYAPDVTEKGEGQTVAIVAFAGFLASDIATYEQNEGLPAVQPQTIALDGFAQPPLTIDCSTDQDAQYIEPALDIENVIAMAPAAQVTVYGVPGASAERALLDEIAAPTKGEPFPRQITTSWLFNYQPDGSTYEALYRFAAEGQAFFSAAGDYGAYTPYITADPGIGTYPFTPVDDPYVTGVGGTTLTVERTGQWDWESAWSSGGGGPSPWADPHFSTPSFQVGMSWSANGGSTTQRNVPDVSAVASNFRVVCGGKVMDGIEGTSGSAPLWAAFTALANERAANTGRQPLGNLNSTVYAIGRGTDYFADFHDIMSGNNSHQNEYKITGGNTGALTSLGTDGKYQAIQGYDLATGWGTPAGTATINAMLQLDPKTVQNPGFDCASLAKLIQNLNKQIATAQAQIGTQLCDGPASFECVQGLKALRNELAAETQIAKQHNCAVPTP